MEQSKFQELEKKIHKLEEDQKIIVNALEKYVKEGINVKRHLSILAKSVCTLKDMQGDLKSNQQQIGAVVASIEHSINELEHNVNNDTHLHSWMTEASHEEAFDTRLTPDTIARGVKNYDDELLKYGRHRY